MKFYLVYKNHGLYDPVLDDTELLYEAIDQDDFDQPSRPTEVQFEPKQFLDQGFCLTLPDFGITVPEYSTPGDDVHKGTRLDNIAELGPKPDLLPDFDVSRSITASPFTAQNRPSTPYRPFSTEPIVAVPPLEDPIILNPDYQDVFGKFIDEDFLPKTKFKLPISEQYDPDGTGRKKEEKTEIEAVCAKSAIQEHVCVKKDMKEQKRKEEIQFMETMKIDIDLEKIELTASGVVEESLDKALTVAKEIQKEIDVELKSTVFNSELSLKDEKKSTVSQKCTLNTNESAVKEVKDIVELTNKTTEGISNSSPLKLDVGKVAEQLEKSNQSKEKIDEIKLSTKLEIAETIKNGSVENISKKYVLDDVKNKNVEVKVVNKKDSKQTKLIDVEGRDNEQLERNVKRNVQSSVKSGETKSNDTKTSDTKSSSFKLQAEQRSYNIGLQTIPNIRGSIQYSSSHFDLLLRTFFVHLTDVMVALSRFILTDHVLKSELVEENQKVATKTKEHQAKNIEVQDSEVEIENTSTDLSISDKKKVLKKEITDDCMISQTSTVSERKESTNENMLVAGLAREDKLSYHEVEETYDKRMLSGAEMAQLSQKKSEELTHMMGAVITEFQNKAGIEETSIQARERSRSRSRAETQITEVKSAEEVSSITELQETKKESDSRECKSSDTKGTNTYIAIVESHVYTNKDAILEEHLNEFTETATVQSAEEMKTAIEVNEAFSTEKVVLENIEVSKTVAEPVVEEVKEMSPVAFVHKETLPVVEIEEKQQEEKTWEEKQRQDLKVLDQTARKIQGLRRQQLVLRKAELEKNAIKKLEVKETFEPVSTEQAATVIDAKSSVATAEVFIKDKCTTKEQITSVEGVKFSAVTENVDITKELSANVVELTAYKKESLTDKNAELGMFESVAMVESIAPKASTQKESGVISHSETIKEKASIDKKVMIVESDRKIPDEEIVIELETYVKADETKSIDSKKESKEESKVVEMTDTETKQKASEYHSSETTLNEIQSKTIEQESSFVAMTSVTKREELKLEGLHTEFSQKIDRQVSNASDEDNNIDTPTPSTMPPTPLTDEYIFRLQIAKPKSPEIPIPRDCTPSDSEDEDPHIVKKKLVPHIETKIEEGIVYDPPLASPPSNKVTPVYTKPGLRGGADRREISKEEIQEIERKSSLLTSAIDETIKSIEAYKEEVGIDKKVNGFVDSRTEENYSNKNYNGESNGVIYNGFAKAVETKVFDKFEEHEMDSVTEGTAINQVDVSEKINVSQAETVESTKIKLEVKAVIPECTFKTDFITKKDALEGYRPIQFNPEEIQSIKRDLKSVYLNNGQQSNGQLEKKQMYQNESGELLGTHQGIVDGLEDAIVDSEIAKELGKPGMSEEKIAELISGESEMLREAHVMGLSRVLTAHMSRPDDFSVDFKKIKPIIESLKDSEVLKALNDEMIKTKEEKKKEERKWTTFLQKPQRATPKIVHGYHGYVDAMEEVKEPYRVKIVKQPKPKVAPDYKPENFNTGLLPWEERALREPTPPSVAPEDPILIPEEAPEILEAVDPLPESEVPDLEDSGIPLPPPKEETPPPEEVENEEQEELELDLEQVVDETEKIVEENLVEDMDKGILAEQLMLSVQNMVDPNASLEQQLSQMRAQLAALAQLPCVIQQSLELVTRQLGHLSQLEASTQNQEVQEEVTEEAPSQDTIQEEQEAKDDVEVIQNEETAEEVQAKPSLTEEEIERMRKEEEEMLEEQRRIEKQKKDALEQARIEHESRLIKQRPTPRVGKPKPVFGPPAPVERPVVLPGGRKWRNAKDAYNEQFISETLAAQAEIIQGKAKGINFMKYEKPPVSLEHLQNSDTYKLVHNMEGPLRRTDMLTPVIAEADYREKCRSISPCVGRMNREEHLDIPEQVQP